MVHHRLSVFEGALPKDEIVGSTPTEPELHTYEVVETIFKRGRYWSPGEPIQMDKKSAARFIKLGELKEIS